MGRQTVPCHCVTQCQGDRRYPSRGVCYCASMAVSKNMRNFTFRDREFFWRYRMKFKNSTLTIMSPDKSFHIVYHVLSDRSNETLEVGNQLIQWFQSGMEGPSPIKENTFTHHLTVRGSEFSPRVETGHHPRRFRCPHIFNDEWCYPHQIARLLAWIFDHEDTLVEVDKHGQKQSLTYPSTPGPDGRRRAHLYCEIDDETRVYLVVLNEKNQVQEKRLLSVFAPKMGPIETHLRDIVWTDKRTLHIRLKDRLRHWKVTLGKAETAFVLQRSKHSHDYELGRMYVEGKYVLKNVPAGITLLKKAAESGHGQAQKMLKELGPTPG